MRVASIGYKLDVMRQSACLVINPITVDTFAAHYNCTPVGRASDTMMSVRVSVTFHLMFVNDYFSSA